MRDHAINLHANDDGTVHDQFCRCRSCKPPLPPRRAKGRVRVALLVLIAMEVVVIGIAAQRHQDAACRARDPGARWDADALMCEPAR